MEKYEINPPAATGLFDWELLCGRTMSGEDYAELLTRISFWYGGRPFVRTNEDSNPGLPCFVCGHCKIFSLKLKKYDRSNFIIVDDSPKTCYWHCKKCPVTYNLKNGDKRMIQVMQNAPPIQQWFYSNKLSITGDQSERNLEKCQ